MATFDQLFMSFILYHLEDLGPMLLLQVFILAFTIYYRRLAPQAFGLIGLACAVSLFTQLLDTLLTAYLFAAMDSLPIDTPQQIGEVEAIKAIKWNQYQAIHKITQAVLVVCLLVNAYAVVNVYRSFRNGVRIRHSDPDVVGKHDQLPTEAMVLPK